MDPVVEMMRDGDLCVPVPDCGDFYVSDKVARIVRSYVGVANAMAWGRADVLHVQLWPEGTSPWPCVFA